MAAKLRQAPAMRLALTKLEVAGALGVSVDFFDDHVAAELACIRRGRHRLYAVDEVKQWLRTASSHVGE